MDDFLNDAMSNSSDIQSTMTRIMCYEIRERHKEAVDFVVNEYVVKNLSFYLKIKRYDSIMYNFGHKFLLGILELFEEAENYEECEEIIKHIKEHNKLLEENIPTSWKNQS